MAHLLVTNGGQSGRTEALGKVTCIGRGLDMDIRIDDLTVSKRHARIIANDRNEYILEDLASSNGTFLNDAQVTTRKLRNGDRRKRPSQSDQEARPVRITYTAGAHMFR